MIGDGSQTSPHVSASGTDDFNIGNKTIDSAVNLICAQTPRTCSNSEVGSCWANINWEKSGSIVDQ
jgi:hypothetical protein